MTKSEYAFRESAVKLFGQERVLYFWTFTLKDVYPDWYYGNIWARFIRSLCDLYGGTLKGLKVVELHRDHGIHWHALLNKRIWAGEVRRIGKRFGIGRVHVVTRPADFGAIDYLSKYLTKNFKKEQPMYARCSRWGTIGGFKGVKVRDVEVDSPYHHRMAVARLATGCKKFPFLFNQILFKWSDASDGQVARAAIRYLATGCISGMMNERS